jgi:hypothetical protein
MQVTRPKVKPYGWLSGNLDSSSATELLFVPRAFRRAGVGPRPYPWTDTRKVAHRESRSATEGNVLVYAEVLDELIRDLTVDNL